MGIPGVRPEADFYDAAFDTAADLAAAMRQYADAEGLSVHLSADEQSVIIRRVCDQPLGGRDESQ